MSQIPAEATNEKLFQEFNTVVAETEQLIKNVAGAGRDKAGAIQASIAERLATAGEQLARIREEALTRAGVAARATDDYVQHNPWRSVGIVAALATAAGLIAGILISRR